MKNFSYLIDALQNNINGIFSSISAAVFDAITKVFQVGGILYNLVVSTLDAGISSIQDTFIAIYDNFTKFVTDFVNNTIQSIVSQATSFATILYTLFQEHVTPALTTIQSSLATVHESIINFIPFAENILNSIATFVMSINTNISDVVGGAISDVGNAFFAGVQQVTGFLTNIWQSFLDTLRTYVAEPALQLVDSFITYMNSQLDNFISFIPSLFSVTKEEAIISPFSVIMKTIQALLGTGASIAIPLTFAELVHPLKEMGFNQLAAYVWELADFKNIGSIILGTLTGVSLATPLRHGLNYLYRPSLIPLQQVDQIFFEQNMTAEQWRDFYRLAGWEERYIDMWAKSMFIKPADRILLDILATSGVPDDWVKKKFLEKGYHANDVEILILYGYRKKIQDEINKVRTALTSSYVDGLVTEDEFFTTLKNLGFTDVEAAWSLFAANIIAHRKRIEERVRAAITAFLKYMIDEDELRDILSSLIISKERIDSIIELAKFRREPSKKPKAESVRRLTASQILNAFKLNIITEEEAKTMLKMLKYEEDAIAILIANVKAKIEEEVVE